MPLNKETKPICSSVILLLQLLAPVVTHCLLILVFQNLKTDRELREMEAHEEHNSRIQIK